MTTKFSDINFGYASAEQEGVNHPELLLSGYFNLHNIVNEARFSPKFLFLGYKGAGKSAISERLRLLAEQNKDLYTTAITLSDLPYSQMKRIVWGDIEPEAKFPAAWSWLILLSLYESFSNDPELTK